MDLNGNSVKEVVNVIYLFTRKRAIKDGFESFPNRNTILSAALDGLKEMFSYAEKYNVDISSMDTIKLMIFTATQLNKKITVLRFNNFRMDDYIVYHACIDFLATTYKQHIDLKKLPDAKNTSRILASLSQNNNSLAAYTYIKGVHESCLCCV